MYYVYILRSAVSSKLYKLYKGSASDLRKRVREHNLGKISSTKTYRPWELVYYEAFKSKTDARREELFLKSGKGRERIKYLIRD